MKHDLHRRMERLQGRPAHLDNHQQLVTELTHSLLGMPGQLESSQPEPRPEETVNHRHLFPFE